MGDLYTKTFVATDYQLTVLLYNFDVASSALKPEHIEYLKTNVGPRLSDDLELLCVGLASPSGPDALNMTLSKMRAETVFMAIEKLNHQRFEFGSSEIGFGEAAARLAGLQDGSEDGYWRGVLLSVRDPTKIPGGRFFQRAVIYDASVDAFAEMVKPGGDPNTFMIPIRSINQRSAVIILTEWFDRLLQNRTTFGNAVFVAHGDSGVIRFDGDDLNLRSLGLYFEGQGYESLFPGPGRLYFAGCDVADGDDGWKFLERTAGIFLKNGGVSYGWTSLGFAIPRWFPLSAGHAVHLWGDVRSVRIGRGSQIVERFGS
jgi:hypothetical protein